MQRTARRLIGTLLLAAALPARPAPAVPNLDDAGSVRVQFARWAKDWDKDHDGQLTATEIGEGMTGAMPLPNFGPGARSGPPGGPGLVVLPLDAANPPAPRP
jgi:hypothetical protein